MPSTFRYQLAASLLLHIFATRAVEYVTVPDVYTTIEEDTIIKCYVMFSGKETSMPDKITFEMVGTNSRCEVANWHPCQPVYMSVGHRPDNFSCGCLLHTDENSYIFYLYLQSCPKDLDNTRYKCSASSAVDKEADGQLRLIDFSKKPDLEINRCEGESVHFAWEYNPNDYESHLVISHISWLFYPPVGDPVFIGTFENDIVHTRDRLHFGDRASIIGVPLKETIPFLEITPLQHGDSGSFQIEIIFLSRDALDRLTDETDSQNETFSDQLRHGVQGGLNQGDNIYPHVQPPNGDHRRAQRTPPNQGTNQSNGPREAAQYVNHNNHRDVLLADFMGKLKPILRSSTSLYIVDPLQGNISIEFRKVRRSGEIFLYCSVLTFNMNTSFEHLSFVLKQHGTVLMASRLRSFLLLKIGEDAPMDNYSCEITGEAVRCAHMRWLENRSLLKHIDYLLMDEKVPPIFDVPFTIVDVMFVLEGVACVFLMIWNCTLMITHVGYMCSRKANFEQKKLQDAIETSQLKRKSALETVKQQVRFASAVTPARSEIMRTHAVSQDASARDDTPTYTDDVSQSSGWLAEQEGSMSSWPENIQSSPMETQE